MPRSTGSGTPALARAFYARPPRAVARALLGRMIVRDSRDGRVAGRIVEVEAYGGIADPASHAFRGETPRNRVMFGAPGHAYVYFTYGLHHCVNVVTARGAYAGAVLIRSLDPVEGLEVMRERRGVADTVRLARGPGCVARALGLDLADNGLDLISGPLRILALRPRREGRAIVCGPRIGIRQAAERPWRYWLAGHPAVSGPRGSRDRLRPGSMAMARRPRKRQVGVDTR